MQNQPNSVWKYAMSGQFVFGRGSVDRLGELAKRTSAKKWLIVADRPLVELGYVERVRNALHQEKFEVLVFDGGQPEPPFEIAMAAADLGRSENADGVIGLGGGSNIDTAKMTAILLKHGGVPRDYFGFDKVPGPIAPLIAIPTTAGTGSEVSNSSVLTDVKNSIKVSSLSQWIRPQIALVDPELTDSCPAKVTAHSGIDSLVHAIEAYTARPFDQMHLVGPEARAYEGANPMGDLLATEAIRLIGHHLPIVYRDPACKASRDAMAWAASLAGMAFSNCGVALVHALEYPVGASVHCSHGEGNGVLLPHVMRFNMVGDETRFANIAQWLGYCPKPNESIVDQAHRACDKVNELQAAIGLRTRLSELGVQESHVAGFAEKSFAIKRLMDINPRKPSLADLQTILKTAL
jgi:alcohol dehydrogenase